MSLIERQHRIAQLSLALETLIDTHPQPAALFRYHTKSAACNRIAVAGWQLCSETPTQADALTAIACFLHGIKSERSKLDYLALHLIKPIAEKHLPLQPLLAKLEPQKTTRSMLG